MNVIDWLPDSDPAIRWQVVRDLTDAPDDEVAAERAKVATEGWGARALAAQAENGVWGGGAYAPEWTSVTSTLQLLRAFGLDPQSSEYAFRDELDVDLGATVGDPSRWITLQALRVLRSAEAGKISVAEAAVTA